MWIIKKEGLIIGSWSDNEEDEICLELSLFRGPNKLVWYHYRPSEDLLRFSGDNRLFTFLLGTGTGEFAIAMDFSLQSITFDNDKVCQVITLVPFAYNVCLNFADMFIEGEKNIKGILTKMLDGKIKIKVAADCNENLYNGAMIKGSIINFIAKYCFDQDREFYIDDNTIMIGYIQDNRRYDYLRLYENTVSINSKYNSSVKFISASSPTSCPPPGFVINIMGNDCRIAHIQYKFAKGRGTSFVVCTELNQKITENDLLSAIREMPRYPEISSFFVETKEDKNAYFSKCYDVPINKNPGKLEFLKNLPPVNIMKASPYAGDDVGISFPSNETAKRVAVTHEGEASTAVEVGQLWQWKMPKKDAVEDFRLTLPDGGTLYYDHSAGEWILAAKSKIRIGIQSTISSENVPNPPDTSLVEIDSNGVKICGGANALARADHKHDITHSHTLTTPDTINGSTTGQTGTISGASDSNTSRTKGD